MTHPNTQKHRLRPPDDTTQRPMTGSKPRLPGNKQLTERSKSRQRSLMTSWLGSGRMQSQPSAPTPGATCTLRPLQQPPGCPRPPRTPKPTPGCHRGAPRGDPSQNESIIVTQKPPDKTDVEQQLDRNLNELKDQPGPEMVTRQPSHPRGREGGGWKLVHQKI